MKSILPRINNAWKEVGGKPVPLGDVFFAALAGMFLGAGMAGQMAFFAVAVGLMFPLALLRYQKPKECRLCSGKAKGWMH